MENLDLRHRKRQKKETRDVWIRSLPLSSLNQFIFESLAQSTEPSFQQISVAGFILSEIVKIQDYNSHCVAANYKECAETSEPTSLLKIFEELFDRIVSNTKLTIESKDEFVRKVWQYKDEGTIDFSQTQVPKSLLKTITADRLKAILLEALLADLQDNNRLCHLLFTCSPSTPLHMSITMKNIYSVFEHSSFHSTVMTFARDFINAIQDTYSWEEFWTIFPLYLQPLFIIQKYIYAPLINGKFGDLSDSSSSTSTTSCVENVILQILDHLYNPSNLLKRVSHRELGMDQKLLSFYIAASCQCILPLIEDKFKSGGISFKLYPSLFLYLRSQNKNIKPVT